MSKTSTFYLNSIIVDKLNPKIAMRTVLITTLPTILPFDEFFEPENVDKSNFDKGKEANARRVTRKNCPKMRSNHQPILDSLGQSI